MVSQTIILDEIYPYIKKVFNIDKFKQVMTRFINKRTSMLNDTCPCDRITFLLDDLQDFYNTMGIDLMKVHDSLSKTYYYNIANFNPRYAKDEFVICMMCIIRILYTTKKTKELELACIYLAFSGKFYTSIHYGSFSKVNLVANRHIMEYVVNNKLSNKYDLKREGSVVKAVSSVCKTWISTYDDRLTDFDDEDVVYLVQQLHDRIKSFMINIASEFYKAYTNKEYMTFDSDNLSEDNYHLADNNMMRYDRYVQKAMSFITTHDVDYSICKLCSDSNIKTDELKSILESILSDNGNIKIVEELCSLLIVEYTQNVKDGLPSDIKFITFTIAPKPNSKNDNINRIKEILENWLDENSASYRKRKSRLATKNSYNKAVLKYFAVIIHNASRKG